MDSRRCHINNQIFAFTTHLTATHNLKWFYERQKNAAANWIMFQFVERIVFCFAPIWGSLRCFVTSFIAAAAAVRRSRMKKNKKNESTDLQRKKNWENWIRLSSGGRWIRKQYIKRGNFSRIFRRCHSFVLASRAAVWLVGLPGIGDRRGTSTRQWQKMKLIIKKKDRCPDQWIKNVYSFGWCCCSWNCVLRIDVLCIAQFFPGFWRRVHCRSSQAKCMIVWAQKGATVHSFRDKSQLVDAVH